MATEPLQIEWLPLPINIPEDKKKLVIRDPLPVIATILDFDPPSADDKEQWGDGPKTLEQFWLMLQHFLRTEINDQLSQIHHKAMRYCNGVTCIILKYTLGHIIIMYPILPRS